MDETVSVVVMVGTCKNDVADCSRREIEVENIQN
jgi:hypothetical protein